MWWLLPTRAAASVPSPLPRRGTLGKATGNLVKRHLPSMDVIIEADRHAEVQKIGDDREQRRFLPAMLRGG